MKQLVSLVGVGVLLAACGRTIATTSTYASQLAPADAFKCVMQQFDTLGFRRTAYDVDALRTSARKTNPRIQISSVQFRRGIDQLDVEVRSGATGATALTITPSTYAEYFNQAGTTYRQLGTSEEATQAARTVAARCGGAPQERGAAP